MSEFRLGQECHGDHFDPKCIGCHEKRFFTSLLWLARVCTPDVPEEDIHDFALVILDELASHAPPEAKPKLTIVKKDN